MQLLTSKFIHFVQPNICITFTKIYIEKAIIAVEFG